MSFRVPESKSNRISIAAAFQLILQAGYTGEPGILAAVLHTAQIRVFMASIALPGTLKSTLPACPEFTLDPIDVAGALLHGIATGVLSVQGIDEPMLSIWQSNPSLSDWQRGIVRISRKGFVEHTFCPTLERMEVERLFTDTGHQEHSKMGCLENEKPVAEADIRNFISTLAKSNPKSKESKVLAEVHFGRTIPFRTWNTIWKTFEGRRRPGEHDNTLKKRDT